MKKMLSMVVGVMVLCLTLTSCEDYFNRLSLYGNWESSNSPIGLKISFSMNKYFDYEKDMYVDGEHVGWETHFGPFICTDSAFVLRCDNPYYENDSCVTLKFSYIMAANEKEMRITDEEGNEYLMKKY